MSSKLFRTTPLLDYRVSDHLTVYFKLDNLQFSGSFKDRGISHMIQILNSKAKISKLIT
jgi:threonine dehydratase